jgi:CRISPR-associated protein Csb2
MMFGLGIRYLNGWAMAAADGAQKDRAEWPPHPDRVFMALAAAWFETGQDALEGEALRWLERLGPPGLVAPSAETRRAFKADRPVVNYVPVNDAKMASKLPDSGDLNKLRDAGLALLPEYRPRQPRAFPVAIPHAPWVYLIWSSELSTQHREPLTSLCRKVTSVGHSASLVQLWLTDEPPAANLVPVEGVARYRLRIFGPGRLSYLEARYSRETAIAYAELEARVHHAKGKEKKVLQGEIHARFPTGKPVSLRPEPGLWQGYDTPRQQPPSPIRGSWFDPRLVVLSLSGRHFSLPATLKLTEALRGTLLAACPEPIPEWLSGHAPEGEPSRAPHVAFLPLPLVARGYADGRLVGLALALPRNLAPDEAARLLASVFRDRYGQPHRIRLFDGPWLEGEVELETREIPPASLRPETWTGPARTWASVTPVVLDRHFDGKDKWERAAETVKDACEYAGLPRPAEVLLHPVSMLEGVPRSNQFPRLIRKKDGGQMHHAHALIVFGEEVQGPVVVGAGRFRGYGFCRPLIQGGLEHE